MKYKYTGGNCPDWQNGGIYHITDQRNAGELLLIEVSNGHRWFTKKALETMYLMERVHVPCSFSGVDIADCDCNICRRMNSLNY